MTDQEMLKKLQDSKRVQAWLLCSKREKELFNKAAGKLNYLRSDGAWIRVEGRPAGGINTYLIDADFQPELATVDCPVEVISGKLMYSSQYSLRLFSQCINMSNFVGVFVKLKNPDSEDIILPHGAAAYIRAGTEVVVRFLKY